MKCLFLGERDRIKKSTKNKVANAGDVSIPELGRSPGEGHDNPLQ